MRIIARIARLELSVLFFSPIAWLIAVVFSIEAAAGICDYLHEWIIRNLQGGHLSGITLFTYPFGNGYWYRIQPSLSLYVALLTMGVFSREIGSGSIRLVLSSPVRPLQIAAGKYLALLIYALGLTAIVAIQIAAAGTVIAHQDLGMIAAGMLGLYLLMAAYMAVGLFMSCLTPHQAVAAIASFTTIGLLSQISYFWQQYDVWRAISDIFDVFRRAGAVQIGVIASSDIVYFLLVIALFLGAIVIKLHNDRDHRSRVVSVARYAAYMAVIVMIGYISGRPALTGYTDWTHGHGFTLTPTSRQIISRIKTPVHVHVYVNTLDETAESWMPWNKRGAIELFDRYRRFLPDMTFKWTYFYDTVRNDALFGGNSGLTLRQLAMKVARAKGMDTSTILSPDQLRQQIDLRGEDGRTVIEVEIGGKKALLQTYRIGNPGEAEISAVMRKLTEPHPVIAFVTGHGERDPYKGADNAGYKFLFREPGHHASLRNQGFDVIPVSLAQSGVPDSINILVIADPGTPYTQQELARLSSYIRRGGHLVLTGEPGRQNILQPIAQLVGVRYENGALVQKHSNFSPDLICGQLTKPTAGLSNELAQMMAGGIPVDMAGATAIAYSATRLPAQPAGPTFHVDTLVLTDTATTWLRPGTTLVDTGTLRFEPGKGDLRKPFPLALALTRSGDGLHQRILVMGDADALANQAIQNATQGYGPHPTANYALAIEQFRRMTDGLYPVDVSRPPTPDNMIKMNRQQFKVLKLLLEWVLPALIALIGVGWLIRRKNK